MKTCFRIEKISSIRACRYLLMIHKRSQVQCGQVIYSLKYSTHFFLTFVFSFVFHFSFHFVPFRSIFLFHFVLLSRAHIWYHIFGPHIGSRIIYLRNITLRSSKSSSYSNMSMFPYLCHIDRIFSFLIAVMISQSTQLNWWLWAM